MAQEHTNRLLSALSHESRELLLARSTEVSIASDTVFYEQGEVPLYGWFLTSGLASTVAFTADGVIAGGGCVGTEGAVGCFHLLGPARMPTQCSMQLTGTAFRIPFAELQEAFWSSAEIRGRLLELVQAQVAVLQLASVCHLQHGAEFRFASYLLLVQDSTQLQTMNLTQEVLAGVLGTRRSTVSLIAADLQRRGSIAYSRGQLRIADRRKLEAAACGCYQINRDLHRSLYRHSAPAAEQVPSWSA